HARRRAFAQRAGGGSARAGDEGDARKRWHQRLERTSHAIPHSATVVDMTITLRIPVVLTTIIAAQALTPAIAFGQQPAAPAPSIASKTTGFERRDGFLPVYVDARSGK